MQGVCWCTDYAHCTLEYQTALDNRLTVSNIGCRTSIINVYDTKWYEADISLQNMLAGCLHCLTDELTIRHMHVQHQTNNTDCGLFTTVFAIALCFWQDHTVFRYSPAVIQPLLLKQLQERTLQPFPSTVIPPHRPILHIKSVQLFCVCHIPDDGWEMVQCDQCDRWYHASCVGLYDMARDWFCNRCVTAWCWHS